MTCSMPRVSPCLLLCAALLLACGPAAAEPFRPSDAATVLERLPMNKGDARSRALAADRAKLAATPREPALALKVARAYYGLAGEEGDPRYVGYAEAALAPWAADSGAPAEILYLRGKLLQWRPEYAPALELFAQALRREPGHYETLSGRSAVLTVLADYDGARRDCEAMRARERELYWSSCLAYIDGQTGKAAAAERTLSRLLEREAGDSPEGQLWLLTRLADLATRLGRPADAERHYRRALALGITSQYLLSNYGDFLIDQGRHAEAVALLRDWVRSDVLLLRLTLAAQALKIPESRTYAQTLRERFAAAAMRGDTLHRQEESRFQLSVEGNKSRALELAVANWAIQREPYDARILLEAAVAAGRRDAAQPVLDWLAQSGHEDPMLAALAQKLGGGRP
jgi:Tfp pilus assembly protein PilF